MARQSSNLAFASAAIPQANSVASRGLSTDPLDGDTIGYHAWLLPPADATGAERLIAAVSTAAGPVAFVAFCGMLIAAVLR